MKKTLPYLFLILSVIFSTFVWNFISIPYDNSNLIIGEYYQKKINPLNDTLRGIFFIFFSLIVYLISLIRFNSIRISNDILINREIIKNDNINFLSVIFIFFCIFEFLSLNYINLINEIDTHHEGTFLSAQLNFFEKDKLWTGTFLIMVFWETV